MMLKDILHRLKEGTEIKAYFVNDDGERETVYTQLDDKIPAFVRSADVYGIAVSDNGVLLVEVEEP